MIPTFGGVIESAKVGTDTANAKILTTELELALLDSGETLTEQNAHRLLKEQFATAQAGGIVPQSAGYGYHFVYNFNNGMIEVKHISEIAKPSTQRVNLSKNSIDLSNWGNVPETCFLNNGYFLLDTAGSALAEVVNGIYTVASLDNLNTIATTIADKLTKDYTTAGEHIKAYLDTVVFIGNGGNFTTATDTSNVDKVVFTPNVEEITSIVNGTSYVDETHPLATLPEGTVLEIPATVNKVSNNALMFNEGVTIHFEDTLEETVDELDIGFTNSNFTFGDDDTVYHLDETGTKIINAETNQEVDGIELTAQYHVTHFDIKIDDVETSNNILSVALDEIGTNHVYQFVAYNFKSGENNFASDTTVTWSAEQKVGETYQTIDCINAQGEFTVTGIGEFRVTATSNDTNTVTATYTVRVGGVTNTSSVTFTNDEGGQLEIEDGETLKITLISKGGVLETGSIKFVVNVETNFIPEIEGIDKSYTVVSSNPSIAEVGTNGTIAVLGEGEFTITVRFNSYDIQLEQKFVVVVEVVEYDCIEHELPNVGTYLYKVGNQNPFDITKLWKFTGEEASVFEKEGIVIGYNIVNADGSGNLIEGEGGDYTINGNMLEFNEEFQGVVKVQVTAMDSDTKNIVDSETIPLEVLDGYNVTTENDLFTLSNTSNKMILNDITLTQYRSNGTHVVNGATLYGNGFTLDGSAIETENVNMFWHTLVTVSDAIVDNVRIIGDTFPSIGFSDQPYAGYTFCLRGNYNEVYNSYFYGSRSPVYVLADSYIKNCVFEGGVLSNMYLSCNNIVLEDVVTIQNVDSATLPDKVTEDNANQIGVGLGVFVDQGLAESMCITLKGDFRQYNWIDTDLVNRLDSTYKPIAQKILDDADEFKHTINGATYVNTGIIFYDEIAEEELSTKIIDLRSNKQTYPYKSRSYSVYLPVYGNVAGTIYSLYNNENATTAGENISTESGNGNRFDSNTYKQPMGAYVVSPNVKLNTSSIDELFKATFENNVFTVELGEDNKEFELTAGMFNVTHFNDDLSVAVKLLDENKQAVDSVLYNLDSPAVSKFYLQVKSSQNYDVNGVQIKEPIEYIFEYQMKIELGGFEDAVINVDTTKNDRFYKTVGWFDYEMILCLFQGLTVTDYDSNGNRTVVFDGDTYDWKNHDGSKLPDGFSIKSFEVNGDSKYAFEVSKINVGAWYNPKYEYHFCIYNTKAADNKGNYTMKIELTYTGANRKEVTVTLNFAFTKDTPNLPLL